MNVSCLVACSAVSREMDIVRLPYPNHLSPPPQDPLYTLFRDLTTFS
jgi:hypothetical protein